MAFSIEYIRVDIMTCGLAKTKRYVCLRHTIVFRITVESTGATGSISPLHIISLPRSSGARIGSP